MREPVLFVSHGSPMLALEPAHPWALALRDFALDLPDPPRALLVISAHWWAPGLWVTGAARPGVLHDFAGFPAALYALDYPAPGHPELARQIADRLGGLVDPVRPLDHGVWTVLRHAWAELPVLQLSLPRWSPAELLRLGASLAPLRDEGVLILASGGLVHNLARVDPRADHGAVEAWALEAEAWFLDRLQKGATEDLLTHRDRAPLSRAAAPTTEHLDPLFVALGAAGKDLSRTVFAGWQYGNLSLRTLVWETS